MTSPFQKANELAVLLGGRRPSWKKLAQSSYTGAPSSLTDGVDLLNGVYTDVRVQPRAEVHRRTCILEIETVDREVYTVTIGGNAVVFDATGPFAIVDEDLVLNGLADAIEASVPASALVNVQRVDANSDGDVDRLVLTGKSEEGYAIAFVVTGAAEVLVSADAESCKARFFTSARGIGELPSGWGLASGRELGEVSALGLDERLHTAGRSRGYLELYEVEGVIGDGAEVTLTLGAWVGPGVQE